MTREELVENLGTIAHSGSKAFLNALKEGGGKNENRTSSGVGFYSVFMVVDKVQVYTRTWKPEGESLRWSSDGSGSYEIETVEGERRGTRIVILRGIQGICGKEPPETIVKNYSAFTITVQIEGEPVNTVQAIWLKSKSDVSEEYKGSTVPAKARRPALLAALFRRRSDRHS